MDAVEEITVSKSSVDAENGNSLGGLISLNMKSGTNTLRGSAYMFFRDPSMNSIATRRSRSRPARIPRCSSGTKLKMYGGTVGGRDQAEPHLQLHLVRGLERPAPADHRAHGADRARAPRRLQPVGAERPRADHLQPVHLDARQRRPRRAAAVRGQPDPAGDDRSGRAEDAERHSAAESAGQHRQLAGQPLREHRLLELLAARRRQLQRHVQDVRALRPVQGRSLPAEPDRRRLLPAVGQQSRRHEHARRTPSGSCRTR